MNTETRRCEWCREIVSGQKLCGCDAETEIERLRTEAAEMRKLAFFADQALGGLDDPRRREAGKYLVDIIYSGGKRPLFKTSNVQVQGDGQA